jgi:hypothetical protein
VPFTLSHPAAVLPLARSGLPVAAMVAGSIAPDVPMFLHGRIGYSLTHSLVGVVTVDLLLSLTGLAVWVLVVRDALVDTAPPAVRDRLGPRARYTARQWALAPLAAVVGSLTHVCWDEFTHPGRWGAMHIAWLHDQHAGVAGSHWAQIVSTALGLAVVVSWGLVAIGTPRRRPRPPRVPTLAGRSAPAVVVAAAVVGGVAALRATPEGFHAVAFAGAVVGTTTLVCCLLAVALAWQLLSRRTAR